MHGIDGLQDADSVHPSEFDLGEEQAIALSGDFDGDGSDEPASMLPRGSSISMAMVFGIPVICGLNWGPR